MKQPRLLILHAFAGNLIGNEYTLRTDLHPDALKYINKKMVLHNLD